MSSNSRSQEALSHGSTNHDSIQGRRNVSHHIDPVQVDTSHSNSYEGGGTANRAMNFREQEETKGGPRSSAFEKGITDRVIEMSKLDSPQIRELARRLGNMVNIETPRYQPDRSKRPPYLDIDISARWQVLQGSNDWKGLLDPLDRAMKAEVIRYGEFAQATYDAFDCDKHSLNYGNPKYDEESLLERVGLENRGYEITKFLFAATDLYPNISKLRSSMSSSGDSSGIPGVKSSSSKQSNWIGFVAVCTSGDEIRRLGRRDILIAWRGTKTANEWLSNITDYMSPIALGPEDDCSCVMVEAGFYNLYTSKNHRSIHNKTSSARDQVMEAIKTFVEKYRHDGNLSITVTGHSLGSALATLCAYDIAQSKFNLLTADAPTTPQRWDSEASRAAAKSNEDSQGRYPHIQSVKNLVQSVGHLDVGNDNISPHILATSVRNYVHEKVGSHSSTASGDGSKHHFNILRGVKDFHRSNDDAEDKQFPKGRIPITVFSFAGPKVGNRNFRDRIRKHGVAVLRVVNVRDLVPKLPGLKHIAHVAEELHKIIRILPSYKHVGVVLEVDNLKSVFLKPRGSLTQVHSLETYLHLVDAYRSKGRYAGIYDKTFRHYALVNKHTDFVLPDFSVPPCWWFGGSKVGMDAAGNWLFPERIDGTGPQSVAAEDEFADFWKKIDEAAAKSKSPRSR